MPVPARLALAAVLTCTVALPTATAQLTVFTDQAEWTAAMGALSVADFDGYTGPVTTQHAGVTFAPLGDGKPTATSDTSFFSPQAMSGNGLLLGQDDGPSFGGGAFTMTFSGTVEGLGLWIGGLHDWPTTLIALDGGGGVIGSVQLNAELPPLPFNWQFLGVLAPEGVTIAAVECQIDASDYMGFDDIAFGPRAEPAWHDEGCALAGAGGAPLLTGSGDLSSGSANGVALSNAAPSAPSGLFLALGPVTPAPFKGGTLKPVPLLIAPLVLPTSPAGTVEIPFVMPAGVPAGTELWVQWAVQDGGAPARVALSNALRGVTP